MKTFVHSGLTPDWIGVPPVFIVGCARAGTTLLRVMLTSHPNISISSEGYYIVRLRSRFHSYGNLADVGRLVRLHAEMLPLLQAERFLSSPDLASLFDWVDGFGASLKSLITFYGTWEARVLGKTQLAWWGDNANYHGNEIPFFDLLFPSCKFIFLTRDPRGCCASSKTSFHWHSLDQCVNDWQMSILGGLLGQTYLKAERIRRIRYEDLVSEPSKQLRGICDFLGVDYTDQMLQYHSSESAAAVGKLGHHHNLLKPVFSTSITRYINVLTPEEILYIETKLSAAMRTLGYLTSEEYERRVVLE